MRFERRPYMVEVFDSPAIEQPITKARAVGKSTMLARRKTMIEKLQFTDDMDSIQSIHALRDKVDELVDAHNQRLHARVTSATTDLLLKMTQAPIGLPLAVVHPMPDGEAVIERLVDNRQAQIVDGELRLTDEGRAQGQAIFDSLRNMVP